jgi:hypothetical protein
MACELTPEQVQELVRISREDPNALADAIRLRMNPSWSGKSVELWKAGMLWGPMPQITNVVGNTVLQSMRTAERALSVGLNAGLSKIAGTPRERFAGEMGASLAGAREAFAPALKQLATDVKDAALLNPERIDPDVLHSGGGAVESHVGKIGGKTGRAVRASFRTLEAADAFYKALAGNQELYRSAYRHAYMEGKRGPELQERMVEIMRRATDENDSSPLASRIRESMIRTRLEDTLQQPYGPYGQQIARVLDSHVLGSLLVPFKKTSINATKAALARTPLGLWNVWNKYRAYRRRGVTPEEMEHRQTKLFDVNRTDATFGDVTDELAKVVLGTAVMGGVVALAHSGAMGDDDSEFNITGGGPIDYDKQKNLRETGWQPYAVKIGDKYYNYKRLSPIAQVIGIAADLKESVDPAHKAEMVGKLFDTISSNVTQQSFLTGLVSAARVLQDGKRYGPQWVKQFEASLVPGIVRAAAYAVDPVQRDAQPYETVHGVPEPIAARIPFLSRELPAMRTATGEPAGRDGDGINPFTVTTAKPDAALEREFDRLGHVPSQPQRKLTISRTGGMKAELTDEEYSRLQDANKAGADRARRLMQMSAYRAAPDTDEEAAGTGRKSKAKMLSEVYETARHAALVKLRPEVERRWWAERRASQGTQTASR